MARQVRVEIIGDDRRLRRAFGSSERAGVRFGASVGRIAGVGLRAFGGLGIAAAGLGVAAASMGIKTAAGLEQAEIGFTQLLHSGTKARKFLAELQSFAAKTPFELPGLIDNARALLGVGVAANKIIPDLTALGDAAGALGLDQERFNRILIAVTQSIAKGKIQSEELMQITEAGLPIWPLLAKAMGKPVPELQKLISQGKLAADDVFPKLFDQLHKDYGGSMAKQSQTLSGIWSTLMDTISIGLANVIKPLEPELKSGLTGAIKITGEALKIAADFISNTVIPALKTAKQWWDDNKAAIAKLGKALLDTFIPAADTAAKKTTDLRTASERLQSQLSGVAIFAANLVKWWIETRIQTTELMSATYSFIIALGHAANALARLAGRSTEVGDRLVRFGQEGKRVAEQDLTKLRKSALDVDAAIDRIKSKRITFEGRDHVTPVIDGIIQGVRRLHNVVVGFGGISRPGAPVGFQHGGRPPVGKAVIVGEAGPELLVLDRPGTILPAAPAPAGRTPGPVGVVLEIHSGGSKLDDLLVAIIKKSVRVRGGGNVQVALGT